MATRSNRIASGQRIAADPRNIWQTSPSEWRVRSESDPGSSYPVVFGREGWYCRCPDWSRGYEARCKHIWAVLIDRENRNIRTPIWPHFDIAYLNHRLGHSGLELIPFRCGHLLRQRPWKDFTNRAGEPLQQPPLGEVIIEDHIWEPATLVVEHAWDCRVSIYVEVDRKPFDYAGWASRPKPDERVGAARTLEILTELGFQVVETNNAVDLLRYDPRKIADLYAGIPAGADLRKFHDYYQGVLEDLSGHDPDIGAQFRVEKHRLLKKMNHALKTP